MIISVQKTSTNWKSRKHDRFQTPWLPRENPFLSIIRAAWTLKKKITDTLLHGMI